MYAVLLPRPLLHTVLSQPPTTAISSSFRLIQCNTLLLLTHGGKGRDHSRHHICRGRKHDFLGFDRKISGARNKTPGKWYIGDGTRSKFARYTGTGHALACGGQSGLAGGPQSRLNTSRGGHRGPLHGRRLDTRSWWHNFIAFTFRIDWISVVDSNTVVEFTDARAITYPTNKVPLPNVSKLPTCQKMLQGLAPPVRTSVAAGAVVSVELIWNTNRLLDLPPPSSVSMPESWAEEENS